MAMTCLWVKRECLRCGTVQKSHPTRNETHKLHLERHRTAGRVGFCSNCGETYPRDNFRFFVEEDDY